MFGFGVRSTGQMSIVNLAVRVTVFSLLMVALWLLAR